MLIQQPENFLSRNRTIKHNHLYLVDDFRGDIPYGNASGMGLYNLDTRFLSCFEIKLHGSEPIPLLSSTEMGYLSTIVFTNAPLEVKLEEGADFTALPETIQLKRETVLYDTMFDRYSLVSYNPEPIFLDVTFRLGVDFKDIFEIRGIYAGETGQVNPPFWTHGDDCPALVFACTDRSGRKMETRIRFLDLCPKLDLDANTVTFTVLCKPREPVFFNMEIQTLIDGALPFTPTGGPSSAMNMDTALSHLGHKAQAWRQASTEFISDDEDFNEMISRNRKDLHMLMTQIEGGIFPAAGIPWYVSLFGRDSLITSRFCLPFNPEMAKASLKVLAKYQGKEVNPAKDEEPGKILHELRVGELARLGEIPHTPYYGSVDATPLWIILLYEYFVWTNDTELLCELWPHALQAMEWIDNNRALHKLGYCTYRTKCKGGILQQGWKDSWDSVMDEDGRIALPPVALVEVQGYVFMAKRYMANLADWFGDKVLRQRLRKECVEFKANFNRDFWVPEMDYYALALDEDGNKFKVISSNPGHCLEAGLMPQPYAEKVMSRLMNPEMFNGWGVRTLSATALRYNPMSYHNGTVWPHDNALIAKGLAAHDRPELAEKIFSGLFGAARHMFYRRLPELFCGFRREESKEGDPPVRYAVACSPQAWSAASMYAIIQSMLNMTPNAQRKQLSIRSPKLPPSMHYLEINNLRVGAASVDLVFRRSQQVVILDVKNRTGELDILVEM